MYSKNDPNSLATPKSIRENLKLIEQRARQVFEELQFSKQPFTIHDLIANIKDEDAAPATLVDYLETALVKVNERVDVDISKSTFYKYRQTVNHVSFFLEVESSERILIGRVGS